jgi:hypothetical protein
VDETFETSSAAPEKVRAEDRARADERIVIKSALATLGTPDYETRLDVLAPEPRGDRKVLMGDDPALPKMPSAPTLLDFYRLRFGPRHTNHMLQSATLALKAGVDEKGVLACLLHDIGLVGLVGTDHGYWGAQLVAPYVDEKVAFAIRYHQALRFFPDAAAGYDYPQSYIDIFGADYVPEPYIRADYDYARSHKWYGMARMITVNDVYAFDPDAVVKLEDFTDIIGRHFRQPREGLGFDNSPVAHMWRTMIWPRNFL